MRLSSRLLVPALTLLSWSIESAYASFLAPGQDLYKRQFRSADYSTSTRPSDDSSNGVKSPGSGDIHSARVGSDAPQKSAKTRRSPYGIQPQESGSNYQREKRNFDNGDFKSYAGLTNGDTLRRNPPHADQKRQRYGSGNKPRPIRVRDAVDNRTPPSAAQPTSGNNDDVTSHSLEYHEKKLNPVRRSALDLNILHIARGLRKPEEPKPTCRSPDSANPTTGVPPCSSHSPIATS